MFQKNIKKKKKYFGRLPPKNWTSGDVKHTNRFVSMKSIILDGFRTTKSLKTIIFEGFTKMFYHVFNDFFKKCQKSSRTQFFICKKIRWFRIWYQILLKLLIWWVFCWFSMFVVFVFFCFFVFSPVWGLVLESLTIACILA